MRVSSLDRSERKKEQVAAWRSALALRTCSEVLSERLEMRRGFVLILMEGAAMDCGCDFLDNLEIICSSPRRASSGSSHAKPQ